MTSRLIADQQPRETWLPELVGDADVTPELTDDVMIGLAEPDVPGSDGAPSALGSVALLNTFEANGTEDPAMPGSDEDLGEPAINNSPVRPDDEETGRLIRQIRLMDSQGRTAESRLLCEQLVAIAMPTFRRRSWGLQHRPDLREDAEQDMIEQLLREAHDPDEVFMTERFSLYASCVGADNFMRLLRAEGFGYKRDEDGNPVGRPMHVPRALFEWSDVLADSVANDERPIASIPQAPDHIARRLEGLELERILDAYVPDALDRRVLILRAVGGYGWDKIAEMCSMSERSMRLHYTKTIAVLNAALQAEAA